MKSKVVLLVLALVMAGSFTTAAVALVKADDGKDERAAHGMKHSGQGMGQGKGKGTHRGHGPPPWAENPMDGGGPGGRGPGWKHDFKRGWDEGWKKEWKSLTPAQRAERMAELAREHAEAVEKWAACVKAAGDDRAERRDCARPIPPGLAKKMSRP